MKKYLNHGGIANELRESSVFFSSQASPQPSHPQVDEEAGPSASQPFHQPTRQPAKQPTSPPIDPQVVQPASQSARQPTNQGVNQPTFQPTHQSIDTSPILSHSKSFYITEQQDRDIDVAVDKLSKLIEGRSNQKIDRSTLVRLLLEMSSITDDHSIKQLFNQHVQRLIQQLTT